MIDTIIDLDHQNPIDFHHAKAAGIVAIIHKATQGLSFVDPFYQQRRALARSLGFAWGAYHFCSPDDGSRQADHFLSVIATAHGDDPSALIALDWERCSGNAQMTLRQAQAFVQRIFAVTGRWPMVYGSDLPRESVSETKPDPILANCPLWLADYSSTVRKLPPTWPTQMLWQYTDGESGDQPRAVPGCNGADRNRYSGSSASLLAAWPLTKRAA